MGGGCTPMYMRNIADIIPKWKDIRIADILEFTRVRRNRLRR